MRDTRTCENPLNWIKRSHCATKYNGSYNVLPEHPSDTLTDSRFVKRSGHESLNGSIRSHVTITENGKRAQGYGRFGQIHFVS
ncbi:hypothetical protein [Methanococcus maripaludis]|uniref:hypothetical protein n=1 Tax=Methanococcus maripaludis TaxID=39152 RepID=UPI001AE25383|nr:hypothetical protein [Methanococcus maripaludis]